MPAWTTYPGLSAPACVVCCIATSAVECTFDVAFPFLGPGNHFPDYDTALEFMDGTVETADCFGLLINVHSGATGKTFSSDASTEDLLILSASYTYPRSTGAFNASDQLAGIDVDSSAILTVSWAFGSWDVVSLGNSIVIYDPETNITVQS